MSVARRRSPDGVATVTVDNPPVNALDDATLEALGEAAAGRAGRRGARGRADRRRREGLPGRARTCARCARARHAGDGGARRADAAGVRAWRRLELPVIAAVQANAVGGGLEFALVCDLIVADPQARFGVPEVTLGLIPGGGGTQRLPRRIGWTAAMELLLLGRLVKAERALELGLVNVVAEDGAARQEAQELAARLAALPPIAVQAQAAARAA